MKNSNDLKTFSPVVFGGQTVSGKGNETGSESGTFNDGGTYQSPPFNPNGGTIYGQGTGINPGGGFYPKGTLSKTIQVIDKNGDPLVNVHFKWNDGGTNVGTITGQNGEATVNVPSESTQVQISYVGKRTHIAKYSDLGSLITLQDQVNNLPPVVVGTTTTPPVVTTEKKTNWLKTAGIGIGAFLLISAFSGSGKKSKSTGSGLSGTKSKKRKSGKKGKKRKGLREPATEITL
jgi:hypothetical protein